MRYVATLCAVLVVAMILGAVYAAKRTSKSVISKLETNPEAHWTRAITNEFAAPKEFPYTNRYGRVMMLSSKFSVEVAKLSSDEFENGFRLALTTVMIQDLIRKISEPDIDKQKRTWRDRAIDACMMHNVPPDTNWFSKPTEGGEAQ